MRAPFHYLSTLFPAHHSPQRCSVCKVLGPCIHDFEPLQEQDSKPINLGTTLGCRNSLDILEPQKILDAATSSVVSTSSLPSTEKKMMPSSIPLDTVICSICTNPIRESHLTSHLRAHRNVGALSRAMLYEHHSASSSETAKVRVSTEPKQLPPASDIPKEPAVFQQGRWVKLSEYNSQRRVIPITSANENIEEPAAENIEEEEPKKPTVKLSELHTFSFRKIREITWLSSCSSDGRLSDVLISIWFMPTPSTYHGGHYGASANSTMYYHERLNLHLVYDSRDNYFIVSAKILKRSSYSTFDTDEAIVSERLCLPEELCADLKRILIYFAVPPRAVFKRFRKMMQDDFIIQYDETSGQAVFALSNHHQKLLEETKNSSKFEEDDDYRGYMGC